MGCGSNQKETDAPIRLQTVNGTLKITIANAKLQHVTSSVFSMDPYVNLKMSNQNATTTVKLKGGKQPTFNETFSFLVNSCYKHLGRNLQVEVMDKNKTADSVIGYGIVDLDPIINFKALKTDLKVFITHERKPAGFINLIVQFKQEKIDTLSLRFQTASIRRKTSTFSNMNCFVQATIGEQVLRTKQSKDTKQMPPVWKDQILTFNVPLVVKNCLIQVYDDDQLVGQTKMEIAQLLKATNQLVHNEQLLFQNSVNAGSLKFYSLTGINPKFSQIKADYKKKVKQEEKQTKDQKKDGKDQKKEVKEEKKDQKKEQTKKGDEPKKQDKVEQKNKDKSETGKPQQKK